VRLDSTIEIDGKTLVGGEASWSLPAPGVCAVTCLPSRATELVLFTAGEDGLQILDSPAEAPGVVMRCPDAREPVRLLVIAPAISPQEKAVTVTVQVDAWMSAEGER
jgi:hypothetical protein